MTERWRKRLEHLDKASPSDDVFDRARFGPALPEAPIPGPSTSTRIVTAIAAFAVFGLAIAVFAIPALRLRESAGGQGSSMLLPIWPVRTLEGVEQMQAWADGGEFPDADLGVIKVSDTLLDPEGVATVFGIDVMGWSDPTVIPLDEGWYSHPSGGPPFSYSSSAPPYPGGIGPSLPPPASEARASACAGYIDRFSEQPSIPGNGIGVCGAIPGSGTPSPFRRYAVYACDPADCRLELRYPPSVTLTMYQPLGVGDGNVWTVLEVDSSDLELGVASGSTVRGGETVEVRYDWQPKEVVAGVHVGTSEGCDLQGEIVANDVASHVLRVKVPWPEPGSTCGEVEPGYVYALVGFGHRAVLDVDPIADGPADMTFFMAATPVMVRIPEPETPAIASEDTESPRYDEDGVPIAWTSYTDGLGWTMEVPEAWSSGAYDGFNGRYSVTGAWFSSGEPLLLQGVAEEPDQPVPAPGDVMIKVWHRDGGPAPTFADDSSFSLAYDTLQGQEGITQMLFRGDGVEFSVWVQSGDDEATAEQHEILRRMVESISFEPWTEGETRNGWTALWPADGPVTWEELDARGAGGTYLLFSSGERPALFGPIEGCGEGQNMTADGKGNAILECPDGSIIGFTPAGEPLPDNPDAWSVRLDQHPVEVAHDGTSIANLGVTIS